jgi:hypothetical protein
MNLRYQHCRQIKLNQRVWLIFVAVAGLGGFLLGWWTHNLTDHSATDVHPIRVTGQVSPPASKELLTGISKAPSPNEDSWTLPRSMLSKYWPSPLINYKTGKFQPMSFFIYGLDLDQSTALVQEINNVIDQLFQLELEHSKLNTDSQGNQYIAIEKFDEAGQQLKATLRKIAVTSCRDFSDQRGELLADALLRNSIFNSFGQFRRELAIEEVSSGGAKKYVLKIHSQPSPNTKEERHVDMSGNYEADRFQKLVDKNLSNNRP